MSEAEIDPIEDVLQRARLLHKAATEEDPSALARVRSLEEARELPPAEIQRRHCLSALARELGFRGWPHAVKVLAGEAEGDLGELMHRSNGGAYTNIWSADYAEASAIRGEHGGYLLPYRRQFFITEAAFVEALGLDASHEDWERIGRDFVQPRDRAAWARITRRAIAARLPAS